MSSAVIWAWRWWWCSVEGRRNTYRSHLLPLRMIEAPPTIQGIQNNVPMVYYRSGEKGWMNTWMFAELLSEKRVMKILPGISQRMLCVDRDSGHKKPPMTWRSWSRALQSSSFFQRTSLIFYTPLIILLFRRPSKFVGECGEIREGDDSKRGVGVLEGWIG